jgi:UDP-N-acetylglucosamine 2-epimerase (non-hydrolysing)
MPDIHLGVGSASHAVQTARMMIGLDEITDADRPDVVLVVGDVNSTLGATLVAAKKDIPAVHVEAGLRSYDRTMPEEINRVLTDQLCAVLYTTERSAAQNLAREGIPIDRVVFVGNVMIDTLLHCLPRAIPAAETIAALDAGETFRARAAKEGFALVTLHRPSNVDDENVLGGLLGCLADLAIRVPVLFPVHPRTRQRVMTERLGSRVAGRDVLLTEPLAYLATIGLMREARVVLTDSGGIQEETTGLGVPCLTLRATTERPITVEAGTNTVVGTAPEAINAALAETLAGRGKKGRIPELWDGQAAERIAADLARRFRGSG